MTDGLHESNMLNSYNRLNNRFENQLYRQLVVSCMRDMTVTHFVVSLAVTMLSTAPNALRDGRIACQLLVRGRYFVLKIVLCLQLWQCFLRLTQHHFCNVWYATCHNFWKQTLTSMLGMQLITSVFTTATSTHYSTYLPHTVVQSLCLFCVESFLLFALWCGHITTTYHNQWFRTLPWIPNRKKSQRNFPLDNFPQSTFHIPQNTQDWSKVTGTVTKKRGNWQRHTTCGTKQG